MAEIVVAVFPTGGAAEAAMRDLEAAGIPADQIRRHTREHYVPAEPPHPSSSGAPDADVPNLNSFWGWLIGGRRDEDRGEPVATAEEYERSLNAGGTVIAVRVEPTHADRVIGILHSHDPIDLEEEPDRGDRDRLAAPPAVPRPPAQSRPQSAPTRQGRVRRYDLDEETGRVW